MKAPKADPWYTYTTNNFFISWSFDEIFLPLTDCKVKKIFPCCILKALKPVFRIRIRIRIRPDPLFFDPSDPDPDPLKNNGSRIRIRVV